MADPMVNERPMARRKREEKATEAVPGQEEMTWFGFCRSQDHGWKLAVFKGPKPPKFVLLHSSDDSYPIQMSRLAMLMNRMREGDL